jgi:hypothetical protein
MALPAQIAWPIALRALVALGFRCPPFHDPFHGQPLSLPLRGRENRVSFNQSSLRYEPYDVRLTRLGQSLMIALASANLQQEVFPGLACLPRLGLTAEEKRSRHSQA